MPAATSAAWTIAVTDPLPLVPATWSDENVRSGWPSAAHSREMFSSPSLMPNVSSAKSRSSNVSLASRRRWRRADRHRRLRRRARAAAPMNRSARASVALHLAAIDDQVEHAVLDEELAALESFGQLLPDRLLDDARPGEADQRLRLGDVQIAEHREAGGHAAGRRIGEDRDERQAGAVEPRQRRRDLGHLHQRQRAFHHARAARARDHDAAAGAARAPSPPPA